MVDRPGLRFEESGFDASLVRKWTKDKTWLAAVQHLQQKELTKDGDHLKHKPVGQQQLQANHRPLISQLPAGGSHVHKGSFSSSWSPQIYPRSRVYSYPQTPQPKPATVLSTHQHVRQHQAQSLTPQTIIVSADHPRKVQQVQSTKLSSWGPPLSSPETEHRAVLHQDDVDMCEIPSGRLSKCEMPIGPLDNGDDDEYMYNTLYLTPSDNDEDEV